MSDSISERARRAAEDRRAREAEWGKTPTELQETAASDLSRLLGEKIDSLRVVCHGHDYPYEIVSCEFAGLKFVGHFRWGGGDYRYHLAGTWVATRRVPRRLLPDRMESKSIVSIADLDGWL